MTEHAPGLFPVPGDGVLARRGDLILLCSLEDSQAADRLLDLLNQIAERGDGRHFTDAIADAIADELDADDSTLSVLAFGPAGAGVAVTVSGGAWADLETQDRIVRVEAGHARMLLRCTLRTPVAGVTGGLSPDDTGAAITDRFSRLDAGTVRAGGLSFYRAGTAVKDGGPPATPVAQIPEQEAARAVEAEPAAKRPSLPDDGRPVPSEPTAARVPQDTPAPARPDASQGRATELYSLPPAEPGVAEVPGQDATAPPAPYEPAQPFEAVLLLDAGPGAGIEVPSRQPLSKVRDLPPGTSSYVSAGPIIQGVYCKNGHFDDPEALFCAICGISMNQLTLVPRPGERPPLGVLLLDDGSVFQLDSDYVVGREPGLDSSVASGKARPLRVSDDSGIVSRVHAKVQLDGWRVLVTDLGSANGTRVLLPGQPADQQLVAQVPIVLSTGSQVNLGGRNFRYESHRGR